MPNVTLYNVALFIDMIANTPDEGYVGCCAAIQTMDLRPGLPSITAPTLVVVGKLDPTTPPEHAELIASASPTPAWRSSRDAAHLASWEQATFVNELLLDHFGRSSAAA